MKRENNLTCCSCGSNDLLLYCIKEYGKEMTLEEKEKGFVV